MIERIFRYGIWGDWEEPYLTLDPAYEAAQLKVFAKMALNGHIYRGRKPVHWSPSSKTALAESELEYPEGHVSPSIYVALPIEQTGRRQLSRKDIQYEMTPPAYPCLYHVLAV